MNLNVGVLNQRGESKTKKSRSASSSDIISVVKSRRKKWAEQACMGKMQNEGATEVIKVNLTG
jgi:uncharacterized radical SAM superfamily protein